MINFMFFMKCMKESLHLIIKDSLQDYLKVSDTELSEIGLVYKGLNTVWILIIRSQLIWIYTVFNPLYTNGLFLLV